MKRTNLMAHSVLAKLNKKGVVFSQLFFNGFDTELRTEVLGNTARTKLRNTRMEGDEKLFVYTADFLRVAKSVDISTIEESGDDVLINGSIRIPSLMPINVPDTNPFVSTSNVFMLEKAEVKRLRAFKPIKDSLSARLGYYIVQGDAISRTDARTVLRIKVSGHSLESPCRMPLWTLDWLSGEAWVYVLYRNGRVDFIVEDKYRETQLYVVGSTESPANLDVAWKQYRNKKKLILRTSKAEINSRILQNKVGAERSTFLAFETSESNVLLAVDVLENLCRIWDSEKIEIYSPDGQICFIGEDILIMTVKGE